MVATPYWASRVAVVTPVEAGADDDHGRLRLDHGFSLQLTKSSHAPGRPSKGVLMKSSELIGDHVGEAEPVNRLERRKQRTRSALIKAAQQLIVEGRLNVPVLEITQLADVGMGSFYNHADSKEELFEAAVADVLDSYGAVLDSLTIGMDDPAETFAASFRLTGASSDFLFCRYSYIIYYIVAFIFII